MASSFVSLGMVVLDELRFPNSPSLHNVTGGSGAYSTFGARVVAGKKRSHEVGCVIMAGQDFPRAVRAQFESWGLNLIVVEMPGQQSTRGLLTYKDTVFENKTFEYTTERLQPMPTDLTTSLLGSASFHVLASPDLLQSQVQQVLELKKKHEIQTPGVFVWEPLPILCQRGTRDAHLAAARLVHVFSPNHVECLALFEDSQTKNYGKFFDRERLESCADALLDSGVGPEGKGAVVLRAAGDGCLVSSNTIPGRHKWLPPFHSDESLIVDATGAGNTFLGALAFGMSGSAGKNVVEAAMLASVAASFSVEQIGLPKLSSEGGGELWNGEEFKKRYLEYRQRLGAT